MRRALEKTRGSDGGTLDLMFAELSVDTALGAYNAILKLVNIEFLSVGSSPPEQTCKLLISGKCFDFIIN